MGHPVDTSKEVWASLRNTNLALEGEFTQPSRYLFDMS